jgi:acylphosphatase
METFGWFCFVESAETEIHLPLFGMWYIVTTMQERIECTVGGRVQMVMFRDHILRSAKKTQVSGYVFNKPDGTVEVVAEGEQVAIDAFLRQIEKGSLFSRVDTLHVERGSATGEFTRFWIKY